MLYLTHQEGVVALQRCSVVSTVITAFARWTRIFFVGFNKTFNMLQRVKSLFYFLLCAHVHPFK